MLNAKLKRILLVEDDIVDAMTVKRALKELKVKNELVHTTDGKKALEYLRTPGNSKPCVIFLDLNMPEMNGIEFLQVIKADGALKSIPVVMLAASSEEKNIVETFNLGVAGYIFKPVDAKKLDEFKPLKMYWTIEQRRSLICLLLLMYLVVANTGYNIQVAEKGASVWKHFAADVTHDLWATRQTTATAMGAVAGILYSSDNLRALINRELVYKGDVTKGVKIVRVNRNEVEFEKNGRRWTQEALASPNNIWKMPKSLTG